MKIVLASLVVVALVAGLATDAPPFVQALVGITMFACVILYVVFVVGGNYLRRHDLPRSRR